MRVLGILLSLYAIYGRFFVDWETDVVGFEKKIKLILTVVLCIGVLLIIIDTFIRKNRNKE